MQKIINLLKNINELVMFKHSIFSLPFIFIAMIVSANGWFGNYLLIMGILAAVSARNFAMAFNRYIDRDVDISNPRTANRPSVDGRLSGLTILTFLILNALIFIVVASFINNLASLLSIPILILLTIYSYFKRFSSLAHLFLGLTLGLAPIAGVVAVEAKITMWSFLLSLGVMFWVAGFDLLYSLQDIEFDKKNKLFSIPSLYGEKATMFISKLFHSLTILFWFLFAIEGEVGFFTYLAIFLSAIILFFEHKIVNQDFKKIDKAFFTLNGYLGIMFFALVVIDYWL